MAPLLWRVEGEPTTPDREGWQQGLTLHLLFQPLTLVVARRDGQTRHYLALAGCPSCRPDGCDRVCHRTLFEQLVRTTLPGVTLTPTSRLVPRAGESRRVLASPQGPQAQLLDAAFLAQWAEGRLILTVSRLRAKPQPVQVGVLLAVSPEGINPGQALRARGWRAHPLATRLHRAAFAQPVPTALPLGGRASEDLFRALRDPSFLIAPAPTPAAAAPAAPDQDLVESEAGAQHLQPADAVEV